MGRSRKYMHLWGSLLLLLFLAPGLLAETNGTLWGELEDDVECENGQSVIELRDFNDLVRRVVITHAEIAYDASAEYDMPSLPAQSALMEGANVRIQAHMDARSGEWTASRIVVIPHHAARFEEDCAEDDEGPATVSFPEATLNNRRTI